MADARSSRGRMNQAALLAEYGEACSTFRTLTDIRFKLLAFLPLVAGVTTAVTGRSIAQQFLISLFGMVVTIGLATYNRRNDQLYDELVGRAAEIERHLGLPDGAFANRPGPWLKFSIGGIFEHSIDHRTGIGIIYGASFALWLYGMIAPALELLCRLSLAAGPELQSTARVVQPVALVLALTVILAANALIDKQRERRESEMRRAAAAAVKAAEAHELAGLADNAAFVRHCTILSGAAADRVRKRTRFYASLSQRALRFYVPAGTKRVKASYLVALITDLPPRWLHDCAANRRGELPD